MWPWVSSINTQVCETTRKNTSFVVFGQMHCMLQSHLSTLLLMSHVYIWIFRIFQEISHIYYSHYSNVFCLFFQFPFPIWSNFYTLSCAVISHQHICKYQFKIFNSCRIPCKQTIKFKKKTDWWNIDIVMMYGEAEILWSTTSWVDLI